MWRKQWLESAACASLRSLLTPADWSAWNYQPQTLIMQQTTSPTASEHSWTSLALHILVPSLSPLTGAKELWERCMGNRYRPLQSAPVHKLTLLLPVLCGVCAFFRAEASCWPQELWLVLGPPVIPKARRYFFFLSPWLQVQT